ncbi:korC [Cronobacter sakazakii]|uniref:korC n=1 Tax=Cronobacter muytjensii TaxID=413501 RepID=UPI0024A9675C|nr:korC [Cronobacter muytjensii]EKK3990669.1 korC [Cronobacter sakazakii]EKK4070691.1 korC [Cronobacter sakazakii]ELY4108171.1 korC [Cronobacter sakazakii]MDI6457885.1 korC [Cronobacter muytjensii]
MALTPEQLNHRQQLVATGTFNAYTLLPGEEWERPEIADVRHVLSLVPLTDVQLANRQDVDERTIRKWKSGETSMVFTTWGCLCWLAGLGMLLEEPA